MKKICAFLMMTLLLFGALCACGESKPLPEEGADGPAGPAASGDLPDGLPSVPETPEIPWPNELLPSGFPMADYDKIYLAEKRDTAVIVTMFGENLPFKKTNAKMYGQKLTEFGYLPCDDVETKERFYISRGGYKVTLSESDSDTGAHLASVNEKSPTGYTYEISVTPIDAAPYDCMFWKYPGALTDLGLEAKTFDAWPSESLPEGFEKPGDGIEVLEMEQKKSGLFITLRGSVAVLGDYEGKAKKNAGYLYAVGNMGMTESGDYFYREEQEFGKNGGEYIATVRYQFCPANEKIQK